jgi:hypothetical protein
MLAARRAYKFQVKGKGEASVDTIERIDDWRERYSRWRQGSGGAASERDRIGDDYPFVENKRAPFRSLRCALPMLNLGLICSAGAYLDGTEPFDTSAPDGDLTFREIPTEVEAEDLLFAARGYDPAAVSQDINSQVPLPRLGEFASNGIIGRLNPVWWSFSGFIPDASRMTETMLPELVASVKRYEVQAALLVPASRLCHQSVALAARALEAAGVATIMLAVARDVVESVRPPRAVYYNGEFGSVSGRPQWPEHQRRILDETLRLLESLDQPTVRKLVVELETQVEKSRGER